MAVELCFSEDEIAGVLWALAEAIDLANQVDALSTMAVFEEWYLVIRRPYDERGEE